MMGTEAAAAIALERRQRVAVSKAANVRRSGTREAKIVKKLQKMIARTRRLSEGENSPPVERR
jgi:hypothetical protein